MSIWIHVYKFICTDSEFVYEFIDVILYEFICMDIEVTYFNSYLWIHIYEFITDIRKEFSIQYEIRKEFSKSC